ncbi:MAG: electron transfer flavoprotein subunit beta/FixA family protein [Candidatus Omnitrophica bacterium]|nr:electron transfer flavoprotein subunit beta/FixA family protein [Candidatus Omnitrophota bacterium]MBU4140919.1 electron transfer flavoprotein subunit beta/FixA family protein [Candidatus Omnitrophota bacterium]
MNIIVCIKQVPETTDIKIDPQTNTLIREGASSIINPYDMYAIEEALRIKEKSQGKVTVITMGPPQAESAIREAISLGCDEGVLITDRAFAGSDTLATSYTLACVIRKLGNFDLVICGKQAMDGDTAQVGPGISVQLDIPQVTYVKKVEKIDKNFARVERMTEEGYEIIETPLPCLFTVVKEINEPRLASLKGKMRAKKAEIAIWNSKDIQADPERLGLGGSPTQVIKIFSPPPRKGGQIFQGSTEEVIDKLTNILKDIVSGCN